MPPKKPLPKQEQRARRLEMDRKACDGELVLPHAVCEIRTACGMTQADFGRHFGLTRKQVIELESGKSNPTLETLMKVCRPFGFQVGFVRLEKFPNYLRKKDDTGI
jgi:DNA-binding XRE family transcriptional regulator|tara:strand:- start:1598 stop:1915 length:318 start_codon:yes stop_codon:yes gene_type:complete